MHNINLVTPEHVVPQVALSILHAKELGLKLPIIYNTSSFDSLESIELMEGLVDIYLADFKVWEPSTSKRLLKADDYAEVAKESIKAMHAQVGDLCFTPDGIARQGVLLRHLVMPGHEEEGKHIMRWLAENVSKDLYVHVMEQYHPRAHVGKAKRSTRGRAQDVASRTIEPGGLPADEKAKQQVRYQDLNKVVSLHEVDSVKKVASECRLRILEAGDEASSAYRLRSERCTCGLTYGIHSAMREETLSMRRSRCDGLQRCMQAFSASIAARFRSNEPLSVECHHFPDRRASAGFSSMVNSRFALHHLKF